MTLSWCAGRLGRRALCGRSHGQRLGPRPNLALSAFAFSPSIHNGFDFSKGCMGRCILGFKTFLLLTSCWRRRLRQGYGAQNRNPPEAVVDEDPNDSEQPTACLIRWSQAPGPAIMMLWLKGGFASVCFAAAAAAAMPTSHHHIPPHVGHPSVSHGPAAAAAAIIWSAPLERPYGLLETLEWATFLAIPSPRLGHACPTLLTCRPTRCLAMPQAFSAFHTRHTIETLTCQSCQPSVPIFSVEPRALGSHHTLRPSRRPNV